MEKLKAIKKYSEDREVYSEDYLCISDLSNPEIDDFIIYNNFKIQWLWLNFKILSYLYSSKMPQLHEDLKPLLTKSQNDVFCCEDLGELNWKIIEVIELKKIIISLLYKICDAIFNDFCIRAKYNLESSDIYRNIITSTEKIFSSWNQTDNDIFQKLFEFFAKHYKDNNLSKIIKNDLSSIISEYETKINFIKIIISN